MKIQDVIVYSFCLFHLFHKLITYIWDSETILLLYVTLNFNGYILSILLFFIMYYRSINEMI